MDSNPYESPAVIDQPRKASPVGFSLTELVGTVIIVFLLLAILFHWFHAFRDNSLAESRGKHPTRRAVRVESQAVSGAGELPPVKTGE